MQDEIKTLLAVHLMNYGHETVLVFVIDLSTLRSAFL
jgi:hypothetical protein